MNPMEPQMVEEGLCCPLPAPGPHSQVLRNGDNWLPSEEAELALLAKAIGHPMRVRILRLLASRNSCVCGDIVEELPLAQSTVSQHLKVLKEAGLIRGEIDGPRVCYCLEPIVLNRFRSLAGGL